MLGTRWEIVKNLLGLYWGGNGNVIAQVIVHVGVDYLIYTDTVPYIHFRYKSIQQLQSTDVVIITSGGMGWWSAINNSQSSKIILIFYNQFSFIFSIFML